MKKINFLAIIIAVLVVIVVGVTIFLVFGSNKDSENNIIYAGTNVDEIKSFIEDNNIKNYYFDKDSVFLYDVEIFGDDADVEIICSNDMIKTMTMNYTLFLPYDEDEKIDVDDTENDVADTEITYYEFTEKDKENIEKSFNKIKDELGKELGCSLEQYDIIPTQTGVELQDNADMFFKGLFVKEYSVMDKFGVLWFLRYEASYGVATATIVKVVNDESYKGIIPALDLTK